MESVSWIGKFNFLGSQAIADFLSKSKRRAMINIKHNRKKYHDKCRSTRRRRVCSGHKRGVLDGKTDWQLQTLVHMKCTLPK